MLEPSTHWNVDYAGDFCRLSRAFGEGDDLVLLFFEQYGPDSATKMVAAGKIFQWVSPVGQFHIELGEDKADLEMRYGGATLLDMPAIVGNIPFASLEKDNPGKPATEAEYLTFSKPLRKSKYRTLHTSGMGKAFAAMDDCTASLVESWGLDPEVQANLSQEPAPANDVSKWVRTEDYPHFAAQRGEPAMVHARIMVDATGAATSCHIQQSNGAEAFENSVCEALMERAEFTPALDVQGKAVSSSYLFVVDFRPYGS